MPLSSGRVKKRAVRVQVDPAKLANMGMTLEDVRGVLVNATVDSPKGTIDSENRSYAIYDNDQLTKAAQYDALEAVLSAGRTLQLQDPFGRSWYVKIGDAQDWQLIRAAPASGETTPLRHFNTVR